MKINIKAVLEVISISIILSFSIMLSKYRGKNGREGIRY